MLAGLWFGATSNDDSVTPIMSGLLFGGIFIAAWWFSRECTVTISPNGGRCLDVVFKGGSDENVDNFVTKVQEAKLKRVNTLFKI